VGILTHDLEGLPLLLHGIFVVAETIDFYALGLDLTSLASTLALNEGTDGTDAGTGGDIL
jgi:hypothetical protein